ncbi:MAG: efflux RND transporter permease subunit, partial [Planctomycetes bacterium]|nr:efflux RND transporter permease subunit [Planctomycetota bacterium]
MSASSPIIGRIINRPITVLMMFLSLIGMGVIAYVKIPINLLPEGFSSSNITIWTPYNDSSAMEVEEKLTEPIEETVRTIPGIKSIRSRSTTSGSRVRVEFMPHIDMDMAYCEIKDRMERIKPDFPEAVRDYYCFRFNMDTDIPIIFMAVLYDDDVKNPFTLAEEVIKAQLEGVDGVANIGVRGLIDDAVRVFLDPAKVRGHRVDLYNLITRMARDNFAQPAGTIKDGDRRYNLRTNAKYLSLEEIEEYPVNEHLKIKDIGEVVLGRTYRDEVSRVNSKEAMIFAISKESQRNTAETCNAIEAAVEKLKMDKRLRGFQFLTFFNQREIIESSLHTLETSLAWGGLFAVIVLYIFLRNIRATLIVAMAIPTSILIALVVIFFSGRTFNILSLAGFTLAVGMLVDNAIVVIENITRHQALGKKPSEASALGAGQVGVAILMATLTTIVVFLPLIFLQEDNNLRLMLSEVGLPISFSLLASLMTALVFIPLSTTYLIRLKTKKTGDGMTAAIRAYHKPGLTGRIYERGLRWTMSHRFGAFFIALLILSSTQAVAPLIEPAFEEGGGGGMVSVDVELPSHFTLTEANGVFSQLEDFAEAHLEDYSIDAYSVSFDRRGGEFEIYLKDDTDVMFVKKLPERVRKDLPVIPGIRYDLGMEGSNEERRDIRIEISGPDSKTLTEIAFELKDRLKLVPELTNIRTDIERGMDEVHVEVDRELAQKFDVNPEVLRGTVAWGLGGQRLPDYDDEGREIRMQIEYDEADVENLDILKNLGVSTNQGGVIPLDALSELVVTQGPGSIVRRNGRTIMGITASPMVDNMYTVSRKVGEVMKNFDFPQGYQWTEEGGRAAFEEQVGDLAKAFFLSVTLVFILMGILFESTVLPLSVLLSVPFACTGSIYLLAISGVPLDANGMVGFILLAGIVVNNAIVLIDHINMLRTTGLDRTAAILQGGRERLRPIFMTAMTTIFGLLPMALPTVFSSGGDGAVFSYRSLAVVVLGGLTLSTLSTLFVVPLFYTFLDD